MDDSEKRLLVPTLSFPERVWIATWFAILCDSSWFFAIYSTLASNLLMIPFAGIGSGADGVLRTSLAQGSQLPFQVWMFVHSHRGSAPCVFLLFVAVHGGISIAVLSDCSWPTDFIALDSILALGSCFAARWCKLFTWAPSHGRMASCGHQFEYLRRLWKDRADKAASGSQLNYSLLPAEFGEDLAQAMYDTELGTWSNVPTCQRSSTLPLLAKSLKRWPEKACVW